MNAFCNKWGSFDYANLTNATLLIIEASNLRCLISEKYN